MAILWSVSRAVLNAAHAVSLATEIPSHGGIPEAAAVCSIVLGSPYFLCNRAFVERRACIRISKRRRAIGLVCVDS